MQPVEILKVYLYSCTRYHKIVTCNTIRTHTYITFDPVAGPVGAQRVGRGIALLFDDHSTRKG